jgi:deaminated glutathione amidase
MSDLVVAAVQMTSSDEVGRNLARAAELVQEAAGHGAALVGLPENFAYLGGDQDHRLALAEDVPAPETPASANTSGPILTRMRELARKSGVWLILGGFPERGATGRLRNSCVLLNPNGLVTAVYRKIHLFDVDLAAVPGGRRFCESETVEPGSETVVADTPWGGLGLSVCYDLRFPELYRKLVDGDARMIVVPSAFTLETGKDHWHVLLRARAIENQAFVFAPAQFGSHGPTRRSYGHALVIDPWGAVVAECGDHEGFALARLDFEYQDEIRAALPSLGHRRL